jgi:hypothetical protein
MTQAVQERKKSFSSFTYKEAFKQLGIAALERWSLAEPLGTGIDAEPVPISDFFRQRLERLQRFDLESLEVSKTLLIDAICEEGLEGFDRLRVWKGAYLEGEKTCGNADYVIAERRAYLEGPFVCVIEAKKDNFEQGTAQCLVEMQACQWSNRELGRVVPIYGIVTNGEGWKFYRLAIDGVVSETLLHGIGEMSILLGLLRSFFGLCAQNLE